MVRSRVAWILAALTTAAGVGASVVAPSAHAASPGALSQQIGAGQSKISSLTSQLSVASAQLSRLEASIAPLQRKVGAIQAEFAASRAALFSLRSQLDSAKARLAQAEAYQARAESVLSGQLVASYESNRPDLVSVVLEATGFKQLLDQLSFLRRIQNQNAHVVKQVRAARRAVAARAIHLGALERRQQTLTVSVYEQRNRLVASEQTLVRQQLVIEHNRAAKAGQLASARRSVAGLEHQLAQAQPAPSSSPASVPAPSGSSGSPSSGGGFTFPMPTSAASPPGTWSLDQGVDISAPGGTPEFAVCSGTIVLHGIGGFGPWAPVLHCDSALPGGYSYVYYGHAGPANQLSVGTHVGAGQTMSEVGPGIVGISTGPHLEIGFADSSGSLIGSGSASQMMSLLQGAYHG